MAARTAVGLGSNFGACLRLTISEGAKPPEGRFGWMGGAAGDAPLKLIDGDAAVAQSIVSKRLEPHVEIVDRYALSHKPGSGNMLPSF